MKKIGIIRCMQTEDICPGTTDFSFAAQGKGAFEELGPCEVIGFVSCGGCPGKRAVARARMLVDRGAEAVALASCICKGNPISFPCPHHETMLTAIPALYALVVRHPVTLSPLARRMDRASFLVYLYHSLVITWFNDLAWQLGISRVSVQFLLRVVTVYTLTFLGAMAWQWMLSRARRPIPLKI